MRFFLGKRRECQCEREEDDEHTSHADLTPEGSGPWTSVSSWGRLSRVRIWRSVLIAGKLAMAQPPTWRSGPFHKGTDSHYRKIRPPFHISGR
jgi:hypothetical protein